MKEKVLKQLLDNMVLPEKKYDNPFIITFCGYSGTGKSTFSKIFSNQLSCYILGGDKIRNILYSSKSDYGFDEIQEITEYVFQRELEYLLNNKVSIVIDRSISSVNTLNSLKEKCDNIISINLVSNDEENKKRIINKITNDFNFKVYGDYDSKSGLNKDNLFVYDEIKKRKVYDIKHFDYEVNTLQDFDIVKNDIYCICDDIKRKKEK